MTQSPSDLYIELTHDTLHSASYVRPFVQAEVENFLGFRSVYMFGDAAYNQIKEQNAVRSLSKFPVYSDTLFVDFDDGDASIESFKKILNTSKIEWKMYFSGSKGYHFHVPIEPMWGKHVPHSQKEFIRGLGVTTADTSIYKHTGLFRLPGTYHKSTGNPKELVDSSEGNTLNLPYIEPEASFDVITGAVGELAKALNWGYSTVIEEPGEGSRHNSLLAVAKHLIAAGASMDTTYEMCLLIHNTWERGYDDPEEKIKETVDRAITWTHNSA